MNKRLFTLLILALFTIVGYAQTLTVRLLAPAQPVIYLMDHYGERTKLVDSAQLNNQGLYTFQVHHILKSGLYTLKLGKDIKAQFYGGEEAELDIIISGKENIQITTSLSAPIDSLVVLESNENKAYYEFLKRDEFISNQLAVLAELPNYFPEKDPFFLPIQKRYEGLQKSYQKEVNLWLKTHVNLLASHYVRVGRFPMMPFNLPISERLNFMKQHWFDEVNLSDTTLIQTNLLTKKAWGYIQLYRDQSLSKTQQEMMFAAAADSMIRRCLVQEQMALFMRNQLVKLFEMLNMENAINQIAERYSNIGTCTDHEGDALKKRLEGSKKILVGTRAPEIIGITYDGKMYDISSNSAERTILVFWASWCPHCRKEMPELKSKFENQKTKNFDVVSVSLDTNLLALKQFVQQNSMPWPILYDGKSWFGSLPSAFYLYATPMFYVLDKNRRIVAKGGSLEEIQDWLN